MPPQLCKFARTLYTQYAVHAGRLIGQDSGNFGTAFCDLIRFVRINQTPLLQDNVRLKQLCAGRESVVENYKHNCVPCERRLLQRVPDLSQTLITFHHGLIVNRSVRTVAMFHAIWCNQMQQNQFSVVLRQQLHRGLSVNDISIRGMLFSPAPFTESENINSGFCEFVSKARRCVSGMNALFCLNPE